MVFKNDNAFLKKVAVDQVISMFDLLPDVLFWIKDCNHNFIHANQAFIDHHGMKNLNYIIGKNDHNFAPAHIAKQFISDDRKILAGEHVTERLEINMTLTGDTGWYSTSKRPLKDANGSVIGSYGITRNLQKQALVLSGVNAIKTPVDYIKEHYNKPFTIEELADIAHLSVSALERRFKKYLLKTPKQFISQVRLENARRSLIETEHSIAQISHNSGFTDHSYFSKQFKLTFGELPSEYRNNYRESQ